MKKVLFSLVSFGLILSMQAQDLVISGIFDGPLSGGTPKVIELTAINNIADLSIYGLGAANNGGGSDGIEYTFPGGSASAGDCIKISGDSAQFFAYFGIYPDFTTGGGGATGFNGDDAIELFQSQVRIDVFGDTAMDGSGTPWEYLDGWVYRVDGTGPDGGTFVQSNWTYSGINVNDGQTSNSTATTPFPICTYMGTASSIPMYSISASNSNFDEGIGQITIDVTISISENCSVEVALDPASTATAGSDFTFTSPTLLNFTMGGATTQSITIPITDDALVEGTETINLFLQNPAGSGGCALGAVSAIGLTMTDNDFPAYPIGTVNTEDAAGVADSLNVECILTGIVHGVDLRDGTGLEFTIIDGTGGIGLFSFADTDGYVVTEGDEVSIAGVINQFRGLTQINPYSITLNSSGNTVNMPSTTTVLDESTESEIVQIVGATLVNPAQWTTGMGNAGFAVEITDGPNTYDVWIDKEVSLYNEPAPTGTFTLAGIGGQRDTTNVAPFTYGYRLVPRYIPDLIISTGNSQIDLSNQISVYPNPTSDLLTVESELQLTNIQVYNVFGQLISDNNRPDLITKMDVGDLPSGVYMIQVETKEGAWTTKFVKE